MAGVLYSQQSKAPSASGVRTGLGDAHKSTMQHHRSHHIDIPQAPGMRSAPVHAAHGRRWRMLAAGSSSSLLTNGACIKPAACILLRKASCRSPGPWCRSSSSAALLSSYLVTALSQAEKGRASPQAGVPCSGTTAPSILWSAAGMIILTCRAWSRRSGRPACSWPMEMCWTMASACGLRAWGPQVLLACLSRGVHVRLIP